MAQDDVKSKIVTVATSKGIDPDFALSLAMAESRYNQGATSPKGARGIMQLMPATFKEVTGGKGDINNPDDNIDAGLSYLKQQLDTFGGDKALAAAAYNAGPGAVKKHGGIPPYKETQAYVKKILGDNASGSNMSLTESDQSQAKLSPVRYQDENGGWVNLQQEPKQENKNGKWTMLRVLDDQPTATPQAQPKQPKEDGQSIGGYAQDIGISAAKGVVGFPEAVVGLVDIPTGGQMGRFVEGLGVRFKDTKDILDSNKTDYGKQADANLERADGVSETLSAIADRPSIIANTLTESAPSMLGGGAFGKALLKVMPRVGAVAASAFGEGAVSAGSQAEQVRNQTVDGLITPKQSALAAATGLSVGLISKFTGKLSEKLGINDVDTLIVGNEINESVIKKGLARKVVEAGFSEGILEEMPQSSIETILQNIALDKPIMDGVAKAATIGTLTGAAMGGGAQFVTPKTRGQRIIEELKRRQDPEQSESINASDLVDEPSQEKALALPNRDNDPFIVYADGSTGKQSEFETYINKLPENDRVKARAKLLGYGEQKGESINASGTTQQPITELATGTSGLESDNNAGSAGNTIPQPSNVEANSNIAATPTQGIGGDMDAGNANAGNEALAEPLGNSDTPIEAKANEAATSPLNDLPEPTQAQKDAGNYKVGRIKVGGLNISVENPDQSTRKGVDRDGKAWESTMNGHYGYVKGVVARAPDKEHVDVNVKPATPDDYEGDVFVVNQNHPDTGKFDEPKAYIGYSSAQEAERAYRSNYADDWQGFDSIRQVPMAKFKEMLNDEKAFLKPVKSLSAKPKKAISKKSGTLPPNMRLSSKSQDEAYDSADAYDYISDKMRNGAPVLTYEAEEELAAKRFAEQDAQTTIESIEQAFTEDELNAELDKANAKLREAGYDENETKTLSTEFKPSDTEASDRSGAGNETRQETQARNEVAQTPRGNGKGQEREGVRPIVEAIVKRRAAANQIGKGKAFDDYLQAAKDFMAGREIKPTRFKLAAASFQNDKPLSDAFAQLAELAKQPAKQARSEVTETLQGYRDLIAQTDNANALKAIARDIQAETVLSDAQVQELDDLVMEKIDGLSQTETESATEASNSADAVSTAQSDNVETQQPQELEYKGARIYKIKIRAREEGQPPTEMWAAESLENTARRLKGERALGGDGLFDTIEEAKADIDAIQKREADRKQVEKEQNDKEQAKANAEKLADEKRSDLDGFGDNLDGMRLALLKKNLDKPTRINGEVLPLREHVRKLVAKGGVPHTFEENAIKGMTRAEYNRANALEQKENDKRIADGGKKTTYSIKMPDESMWELGKNAHDFAKHLVDNKKTDVNETNFVNTDFTLTQETNEKVSLESYFEYKKFTPLQKSLAKKTLEKQLRLEKNGETKTQKEWIDSFVKDGNLSAEIIKLPTLPEWNELESPKKIEFQENENNNPDFSSGETYFTKWDEYRKTNELKNEYQITYGDLGTFIENKTTFEYAQYVLSKVNQAPTLELTSETNEQILAREQAQKDAEAEKAKADAKAKADEDKRALEAQQRKNAAERPFEFGEDNKKVQKAVKSGSEDLFAQAEDEKPAQSIQDLGEKIGGARKDTAVPTGKSPKIKSGDDRPAWAKRFEISQIAASTRESEVGKWSISDTRRKDAFGQNRRINQLFDSREEAETALPLLAVALKHKVYGVGKQADGTAGYEIYREISDRKRVKVVNQVFATREKALEYMAKNAEAIIETNTTFGEIDLPRPPSTLRTGVARRKGDVQGQDFMDTFGLRGVEFGNWNNQDDRQDLMNDAYDGLMDLAEVMNIPSKAIGLNGELALAFGARGQGLTSAKAHYERDKVVINLTKMNGAGSLAHEWFHALDHYFARQDGKAKSEWKIDADGTKTLPATTTNSDYLSHGISYQSKARPELTDAYKNVIQTIVRKATQFVEDTEQADRFVARAKEDLEQGLKQLRDELSRQLDPKYWKRNNKPASAEQLVEFDTVAKQLVDGTNLETELKEKQNKRFSVNNYVRTNDALDKLSEIYKAVRGRSGFGNSNQRGVLDNLRQKMTTYDTRLKMLKSASSGEEKTKFVPTEFVINAKEIDQGRGEDYWTTPHELAARAFQAFVEDKIGEKDGFSPFLNYAPDGAGIDTPWGFKYVFPKGDERKLINKAFDKFVDVLQTKETDNGNVAMFSRTQADGAGTLLVDEAERIIKDAGISVKVDIYPTMMDAPIYVQRQAFSEGATGVEGFFDTRTNRVAVVLENINSDTRLTEVVRHEVIGHYGMENMLNDADPILLNKLLTRVHLQVKSGNNKVLNDLFDYVLKTQPGLKVRASDTQEQAKEKKRRVAKEVIAVMAERNMQNDIVKRMLDAIRKFFKKIGLYKGDVSDAEIASLLRDAQRYLNANGRSYVTPDLVASYSNRIDAMASFSLGENLESALLKWGDLVDDYQAGRLDKTKAFELFDSTPASMQVIGMPDLPVKITSHSLDYIGERLSVSQFKQLPKELSEPALVYVADDTKTGGVSANFVTNIATSNGKIVVAIKPSQDRVFGGKANYVATVIAIPNMVIESKIRQGRALYVGDLKAESGYKTAFDKAVKEKATESVNLRKSFLQSFGSQRPVARIMRKSDVVNMIAKGQAKFSVASLPDTITVDGKQRPTLNSNGKPIHPTLDGIENFWRWFEDSKVVDEQGRPMVVYHGGTATDRFSDRWFNSGSGDGGWLGKGFYFTPDLDYAQSYVDNDEDKQLLNVFVTANNPYIIQNSLENGSYSTSPNKLMNELGAKTSGEMQKILKDQGYDSIILKDYEDEGAGIIEVVAFNPNQIKSAIGNTGSFDANNDSIMFSRTNKSWHGLEETGFLTNLIYKFQDKHKDLKDVTKAIKQAGNDIADRFNTYLQEELYHGRVAKRTQGFVQGELEPLLKDMNAAGISIADFEHYLWARHAEERNAQIAKVNPDMPDGGSGLTNAEARAYLGKVSADSKAKYEVLAKQVDAINKRSRQLLVEYGIEDMGTLAAMEGAYKHYVPLMRDEMEKGFGGTGQGFSIKGNSTKRAMGSDKAVVDILANIAQQREKFIVRGEKNRVATALVGLAKTNPNDDFWKVDTPPKIRFINKTTGLVDEITDPLYKSKPNVVVARIMDSNGKVQERSVVFNEYDERASRMAESLKNLDVDGMEEWVSNIAKITRYFASVNTQYNPLFGVVNITRDIQAAALNLSSTELANNKAEVLANTGSALKGIYTVHRGDKNILNAFGLAGVKKNRWADLWEEFQKEGGQTGYRELFRTAADRTKKLEDTLNPKWWAKDKLSFQQFEVTNLGKSLFQWLEDYNTTLENSVRLSAYKVALDKGMTKQQAASLAKNLTVNFNRKGASGARMGAFYAFFNASTQGTARIAETMFKDGKLSFTGKRILAGGAMLGIIQAFALAGFDDEEPPQFERDRNLIVPLGNNKYVKIPMPLGFHVIPSTSRIITEFMLNGGKDPAKMIAHIGSLYAEGFNPVGGNGSLLQILSPTVSDPIVALSENQDFAGRNIYQKDFNSLNPTPGFTRAKDTASKFSLVTSELINKITGGTEYTPGFFSPTPDQIDYLIGQITGGVGREYIKSENLASSLIDGADLPPYKIPLLGKFYGNSKSQASEGAEFYRNVEAMNSHKRELQGRQEKGESTAEYLADNPSAVLWRQSNFTYNVVNKLRKRRDALLESGATKEQVIEVDAKITEAMKRLNELVAEKENS